jgi:hypothetical protein
MGHLRAVTEPIQAWRKLHNLIGDTLMHVKCIHKLCSLLDHIPSYLIVYEDLDLFAIDFRVFLNNPLSFGFNTVK